MSTNALKTRIRPYEYYVVSYFKKCRLDSMSIGDLKNADYVVRILPSYFKNAA